MYHVMFDIDGTLIKSMDFDSNLFTRSIEEVLGHSVNTNWWEYTHVTDTGIISEIAVNHGRDAEARLIEEDVKGKFLTKMEKYLNKNPAKSIEGAGDFIDYLLKRNDVELSIATGGWRESALMKLKSAGIYREAIPIATSNDHFSRTEIMKIAKSHMKSKSNNQCTYFGDAIWDRKACETLTYNFILVGDYTSHHQQIDDFRKIESVIKLIGIE